MRPAVFLAIRVALLSVIVAALLAASLPAPAYLAVIAVGAIVAARWLRIHGFPEAPFLATLAAYMAYTILYALAAGSSLIHPLRSMALILAAYAALYTLTPGEKKALLERAGHRLFPVIVMYTVFNGLLREARETIYDVKACYRGRFHRSYLYASSLLSNTPSLALEAAEYMFVHRAGLRGSRGRRFK